MKQTIKIHDEMQELHRVVIENTVRLRNAIGKMTPECMTDVAYGLKEISRLLDDGRKECDDLVKLFEKALCIVWVQRGVNTGNTDPFQGEFAVGTPQIKQMVRIPRRDTDEYDKLMQWLGVPDGDLVRPHWPSMVEHVTELLSQGQQPPDGMTGEPYPIYAVRFRKRKEFHDE